MTVRQMRKVLQENGYTFEKSRVWISNPDNHGDYRNIHNGYNTIVAGSKYEPTPGEVSGFTLDNIGSPLEIDCCPALV